LPGLLPGDRWTRVELLFVAATDLAPDQREEFVTSRCGEDAQLREEVLSLLRYDAGEDPPPGSEG
jgi:hypothetical protein